MGLRDDEDNVVLDTIVHFRKDFGVCAFARGRAG
jgi:hypothetical protein